MSDFEKELAALINRYSLEKGSDTPDWMLASFLLSCLSAFNATVENREHFFGRTLRKDHGPIEVKP